jgi:hypothetical protein
MLSCRSHLGFPPLQIAYSSQPDPSGSIGSNMGRSPAFRKRAVAASGRPDSRPNAPFRLINSGRFDKTMDHQTAQCKVKVRNT